MGDSSALFEIILFAILAGFLVIKLRGVLGKRTGHEKRHGDPFSAPPEQDSSSDNVIQLPGRDADGADGERPDGELSGTMRLKMEDPSFDEIEFLKGARTAFEWVVDSFAKGDRDALRSLLADDLMIAFAGAIDAREEAGLCPCQCACLQPCPYPCPCKCARANAHAPMRTPTRRRARTHAHEKELQY